MEPREKVSCPLSPPPASDLPLKLCNPLVPQAVVPPALALLLSGGAPTQLPAPGGDCFYPACKEDLQPEGNIKQGCPAHSLHHSQSARAKAAPPLRPRPLTRGPLPGHIGSGGKRGSAVPAGLRAGLLCDWGLCGRDRVLRLFPPRLLCSTSRVRARHAKGRSQGPILHSPRPRGTQGTFS